MIKETYEECKACEGYGSDIHCTTCRTCGGQGIVCVREGIPNGRQEILPFSRASLRRASNKMFG